MLKKGRQARKTKELNSKLSIVGEDLHRVCGDLWGFSSKTDRKVNTFQRSH